MEERSYLPFPRSFAFFFSPFTSTQASPEENVRKRWRCSFFHGKRKSQRMMSSEECMYLPFRCFSVFFFLFFPFICTQWHNPFRLRLIPPRLVFKPAPGRRTSSHLDVRKRGLDTLSFFHGERKDKRMVASSGIVLCFFATSVPSFSFSEKVKPKSRWRPVE